MINDERVLVKNSLDQNSFKEFISCGICKGVSINPVICLKCSHCFCKVCAEIHLTKSKQCPYGCSPFNFTESKLMNQLLSSIKFRCKNECGKEIPYKEFEDHYNLNCEKADFKTKFENEDNKRNEEKRKVEELSKAVLNKIDQIKVNEMPQYTQDKILKIFVSKYHLHPLDKDFYKSGIRCSICQRYLERNSDKYICEKCKFYYCFECKNEELKENSI